MIRLMLGWVFLAVPDESRYHLRRSCRGVFLADGV
jgi:hypothetical protein